MIFRKLKINDFNQYKQLLNEFRSSNFTMKQFKNFILHEENTRIYVLEDKNKLYATGTILTEKKFIHDFSLYCHIEDIIVKNEFKGKGYGTLLMKKMIDICKQKRCYKMLLDCDIQLIQFYEKCGFTNSGFQMTIYL